MSDQWTFEVTDDSGLMSLIDPSAYASFLSDDFTFEEFKAHCLSEMRQHRMLIWGTGVESSWRVQVCLDCTVPPGFREIVGGIHTSHGHLAIVNYEDLSMAGMFPDLRLPLEHASHVLDVPPGKYDCRIVQLEDPEDRYEDAGQIDFIIQLSSTPTFEPWTALPWFN